MYSTLVPVVAPIFICAGLGWAWARLGRPFDTSVVTTLATHIGTPCLVFASLVRISVPAGALIEMGLATLAALACFAAIGGLALRAAGLPLTTYLSPVVFGNTGNMALPLCLFAFGAAGLELAIVFFSVSVIVLMTLGMWLVSGSPSPMSALKTPLPYGALAAVAFLATGSDPPEWLYNTTKLLGQMTIPLMLITLGVALARMKVSRLGRSALLSALRLGGGFAIGLGLASALDLEGVTRSVFIVQCAMPVAVFNYLFAHLHRRAPEEVAGAVVMSTAISFATLPLLMAYVLGAAAP